MPVLLSGPAGAGKSAAARGLLAELGARPGVIADFQALYAALLLLLRGPDGRYPERSDLHNHVLALAEYVRLTTIREAGERGIEVIATNSDGAPERRNFLLSRLGAGAREVVLDPGRVAVETRLAGAGGMLSPQCREAADRWYGRLP